ncbi:PIN domain-containing protein [Nakamurella sp. YIM 132087]|uniref:Ribonuclease VapC n=1 Tax=Nakamurella alba TaxID=2665158 RepID=A0A7K1FQG9_9ACTN|nr:type II toxin-antitoxin system VapC family toxin [Nakamurella alba]MTD15034.1 PIN domain-containing protein [Nakamurella alba]
MTTYYLDTSAAAKLLVNEAESQALALWSDGADVEFVAIHLLEAELRRFALRLGLPQSAVTEILDAVVLHDVPPSMFREAGTVGSPLLRTLDALHLVGAIRLGVRAVVTYDGRLGEAADRAGLEVIAPS